MNCIREKNRREKNPNHYYYTIKWDNNIISTYIHQDNLLPLKLK